MRTNRQVVDAWRAGHTAESGHMRTDGKRLFSYWLQIGFTTTGGTKVLIDCTAGAGRGYSMTTSQHVSHAWSGADLVVPGKNVCAAENHGYWNGQPTRVWMNHEVWNVQDGKEAPIAVDYLVNKNRSYYDRTQNKTVGVKA